MDKKLQAIERAQKKLQEAQRYAGPSPHDGAVFKTREDACAASAKVAAADRELFLLEAPQPWPAFAAPEWGGFAEKEQRLEEALAAVRAAVAHLPEVSLDVSSWDFPVPDRTCSKLVRMDKNFVLKYMRRIVTQGEGAQRTLDIYRAQISAPLAIPYGLHWVGNPNLVCSERAAFNSAQAANNLVAAQAAEAVDRAAYAAATARIRNWGESTFFPLYGALCRAYGLDESQDVLPSEEVQRLVNQANAAAEDWRYYVFNRMTCIVTVLDRNTDLDFVVREAVRPPRPTDMTPW